ncbi:hypothetical protein PHYC_01811 [Phycisphaerales bacterium]|nr:hypothetical protein PHYC_01811 [Phycisphaerales bacterium]
MIDVSKFKAGQDLICTVAKTPGSEDACLTIERLMRLDPANKKALRRAQRMRKQRELVYTRGNRDWVSREKPARVVHVTPGESWTLAFNHDVARDLSSVGEFLTVKAK